MLGRRSVPSTASSLNVVQCFFLLHEASGLLQYTFSALPLNANEHLAETSDLAATYNRLTTSRQCWYPAALWFVISFVLPLIFAYVINPTKQSSYRCTADPFTFNLARLGLAFMVYNSTSYRHERVEGVVTQSMWGALLSDSVGIVRRSVRGGYTSLLAGPIVCAVFSVYVAILESTALPQHPCLLSERPKTGLRCSISFCKRH